MMELASPHRDADAIDDAIRTLTIERAPRSVCPSEVARALAPEGWRALMEAVRERAAVLAERGEIAVTQRGRTVDVRTARGPVRLVRRA